MPRASDLLYAVLIAPAGAMLAIAAGVLIALNDHVEQSTGIHAGLLLFVLLPPATILLRARTHHWTLGWTCVALGVTVVALAATLWVLVGVLAFGYERIMGDFA